MTELEKYQMINSCESDSQLEIAMRNLSDNGFSIKGLTRDFDLEVMIRSMYNFIADNQGLITPSVLTRSYGIRQQAMYIKHYNK